jgi:hypothetical protein
MLVREGEPCPTCGVVYKGVYKIWMQIRQRCNNPNAANFHNYGGRGITICPEWDRSYEAFAAYMGPRPSLEHTIDRIDVNGNYEPGNVRWADDRTQRGNRRTNVMVTWNNETRSSAEWARVLGISRQSMRYRMKHWPIEDVFGRAAQDGHRQRYDANLG